MAGPQSIDPRDVGTPDDWVPRHEELIRLTGRHPFNCEPPLAYLRTFVTPTPLHYVRNHGAVPPLAWESHQLRVDGLVATPITWTMDELVECFAGKIVSLPVLLVCAGNRRKEQNMIKKSIGFSWGAGAASTAVWTGVRLQELLAASGVDHSRARFVWFEGADALPHDNYGTCIPARTALDPACDVLVAWAMNGEPLSPDHGFPLRIIVPGHIGGRMVKWLTRIHVSEVESSNHHHLHDNRVLPSHVDAQRASDENWWARPEFAIQELNINSVVLTPAHGEQLTLSSSGVYTVSGYAYSGGGRRVIRVEATVDDGKTWQSCQIKCQEQPNAHGKMWCWVHYELELAVPALVRASELCVRAWDAGMNTQPEFPTWNVMGMMNNAWFRVKIHRAEEGSELLFEHPTQAGSLRGGWMTLDRIAAADHEAHDEPVCEPVEEASGKEPVLPEIAKLRVIPRDEIARHNTKESCWFICRGLVYDATDFLSSHPGGAASILLCAGQDCTEEFESIHSVKAWQLLAPYCIGRCEDASDGSSTTVSDTDSQDDAVADDERGFALAGAQRVPLVLISKQVVSHDTRIFRFALPAKHLRLGLPIGNHVLLYAKINGKSVVRAYTPISASDEEGFVSLLIKVYWAGTKPSHPEGGLFSQYLDDCHLGTRVEMKGPVGHFTYHGLGRCSIDGGRTLTVKKIGFIAGGTGITPVFQIMRAILSTEHDNTRIALIYCVRKADDLLLREELERLQRLKPSQCQIYWTLTELGQDESPEWKFGRSRLTDDMVRQVIGADACHVALCGPPGMVTLTCLPSLQRVGYDCTRQVTIL